MANPIDILSIFLSIFIDITFVLLIGGVIVAGIWIFHYNLNIPPWVKRLRIWLCPFLKTCKNFVIDEFTHERRYKEASEKFYTSQTCLDLLKFEPKTLQDLFNRGYNLGTLVMTSNYVIEESELRFPLASYKICQLELVTLVSNLRDTEDREKLAQLIGYCFAVLERKHFPDIDKKLYEIVNHCFKMYYWEFLVASIRDVIPFDEMWANHAYYRKISRKSAEQHLM